MKGDEIVRARDRHSNETVTLRKHVTKYKSMQKWLVEFLRKSESHGDKIARLPNSINSIILFGINSIPNLSIYLNFVCGVEVS